jgi:hypothetical protein
MTKILRGITVMEGVVGMVYVPKDADRIPDKIVLDKVVED